MSEVCFVDGVFTIDGQFQLDIGTSHYYHEAAVALPAAYVRTLRRVLVLGGGDGCSAAVALRFQSVEHITVVDWDPQVTGFSRTSQAMRSLNRGSLSHPKVSIIAEDAAHFIEDQDSMWDLIVMDFTASNGDSPVDTPEFMSGVEHALSPGGAWSRNLDMPWSTVARWPWSGSTRRTYPVTVGPNGFQPFLIRVLPIHPCLHPLTQPMAFMTHEVAAMLHDLPPMTERLARIMAALEG